jgi:hypothetical protein
VTRFVSVDTTALRISGIAVQDVVRYAAPMTQPSEPVSGPEPELDDELSEEEEQDEAAARQTTVLRASGVLLLVAVLAALLTNIMAAVTDASAWVPLVIDVAVGAALVTGDGKAKSFAIFRASVGLLFSAVLLMGALKVGKREMAAILLVQSLVSSSLLVLLWGEAGRLRFRVGLAVGIVAVLLSLATPIVWFMARSAS